MEIQVYSFGLEDCLFNASFRESRNIIAANLCLLERIKAQENARKIVFCGSFSPALTLSDERIRQLRLVTSKQAYLLSIFKELQEICHFLSASFESNLELDEKKRMYPSSERDSVNEDDIPLLFSFEETEVEASSSPKPLEVEELYLEHYIPLFFNAEEQPVLDIKKWVTLYGPMQKVAQMFPPNHQIVFHFIYHEIRVLHELSSFFTRYSDMIPYPLRLSLEAYQGKEIININEIEGTGLIDINFSKTMSTMIAQGGLTQFFNPYLLTRTPRIDPMLLSYQPQIKEINFLDIMSAPDVVKEKLQERGAALHQVHLQLMSLPILTGAQKTQIILNQLSCSHLREFCSFLGLSALDNSYKQLIINLNRKNFPNFFNCAQDLDDVLSISCLDERTISLLLDLALPLSDRWIPDGEKLYHFLSHPHLNELHITSILANLHTQARLDSLLYHASKKRQLLSIPKLTELQRTLISSVKSSDKPIPLPERRGRLFITIPPRDSHHGGLGTNALRAQL